MHQVWNDSNVTIYPHYIFIYFVRDLVKSKLEQGKSKKDVCIRFITHVISRLSTITHG